MFYTALPNGTSLPPIPMGSQRGSITQELFKEYNISLDRLSNRPQVHSIWQRINPYRRMVLIKSKLPHRVLPNSRERLPLLEKVIFSLEKESIPLWNKVSTGLLRLFWGKLRDIWPDNRYIGRWKYGAKPINESQRYKIKKLNCPLNILHGI